MEKNDIQSDTLNNNYNEIKSSLNEKELIELLNQILIKNEDMIDLEFIEESINEKSTKESVQNFISNR